MDYIPEWVLKRVPGVAPREGDYGYLIDYSNNVLCAYRFFC